MDETLISRIPDSVLPFPDSFADRLKYIAWKYAISWGFERGRDLLLWFGFIKHKGRQNYTIGRLAPGVTVEQFLEYLGGQRFGNNFFAWIDDNQVISLRRLDGFKRQYHLRVFRDGEVRGHYEWTPEAYPSRHMKEVGMEERRADFERFLGDWVVPMDGK